MRGEHSQSEGHIGEFPPPPHSPPLVRLYFSCSLRWENHIPQNRTAQGHAVFKCPTRTQAQCSSPRAGQVQDASFRIPSKRVSISEESHTAPKWKIDSQLRLIFPTGSNAEFSSNSKILDKGLAKLFGKYLSHVKWSGCVWSLVLVRGGLLDNLSLLLLRWEGTCFALRLEQIF